MSIYSSLLTTTGAAQYAYNEANALATVLSQVALGDNNGVFFTPTINDGEIVHQVHLASINSITVDPLDSTIDNVEVVLPYNIGGWTIREFRILDSNGTVMYTGNCEIAKTILSSGQAIETQIIFPIKRVNTAAVTLNFDTANLATFQYVTNAITNHNNDVNAHGAAAWATKVGVQSGQYLYTNATGTTTAYIATLTPAIAVLTNGMVITVNTTTVGTNTTTTPTLNLNGLGAITIVKEGAAFRGGDIPKFAHFQYNATLTRWVLLNPEINGILDVKTITSTQVYTPTTGTKFISVEIVGGGGSGGGSPNPSAGFIAAGGGGGGAGYCRKVMVSGFSGVTVTIGAGGALPAVGVAGNNGGTSSFGAILSAGGGVGGAVGVQTNVAKTTSQAAAGGSAAGGDININGGSGLSGVAFATNSNLSGIGGASLLGFGGGQVGGTTNGGTGTGYGSGGSGAASVNAGGATQGGVGTAGVCIITEYGY